MEIDVEQIMQEIRSELANRGEWEELPPFDSVPIRTPEESAPVSAGPEQDQYSKEVEDMNREWELVYYWPLSSNPVKRFTQRGIKRLLKFLFVPVIGQQNIFNASTVRSMNWTKGYIDGLIRRSEGLEHTEADLYDLSSGLRLTVDAVEHQTAQLDRRIDDAELKTGALHARLAAFEQYTESLHAQIADLTDEASALRDRITKLEDQNAQIISLTDEVSVQQDRIAELEDRNQMLEALYTANEKLSGQIRADQDNMAALAREVMLAKWKIIDHLRQETEKADDLLTCKICGSQHRRSEYETRQSECIFNGGILTRYVCPDCGVVFGPSKFTDQEQKEIDEDYRVHYLGYSEGDSSYKEEKAFRLLDPEKGKLYLNYGCGKWSKTLQKLRAEGYLVYGYEPYAAENDNPYLITKKEELAKYRFDGIFSNDVLEHFIDPAEDLRFMKSLLMDEHSRMAHSTACYTYKYDYTRFHTHFFLGKSAEILAEKAGLEIVGRTEDLKDHDFICYIYAPKETESSILNRMVIRKKASFSEEGLQIRKGGQVCGPYLTLPPGKYSVRLDAKAQNHDEPAAAYKITLKRGELSLDEGTLFPGGNELIWEYPEPAEDFEIVIEAGRSITLKDIRLCRAEE